MPNFFYAYKCGACGERKLYRVNALPQLLFPAQKLMQCPFCGRERAMRLQSSL